MARRKMGMSTLALLGGGAAAVWYFFFRPKGAPGLVETYPGEAADLARAQERETARIAEATEARYGTEAGLIHRIIDMTHEELRAVAPVASEGITKLQWDRLKRRYPDAYLLNAQQSAAVRKNKLVPDRIRIIAASPTLKQPDIPSFGVMAVLPEGMIPVDAAALAGFGAQFSSRGGGGVTGLGY